MGSAVRKLTAASTISRAASAEVNGHRQKPNAQQETGSAESKNKGQTEIVKSSSVPDIQTQTISSNNENKYNNMADANNLKRNLSRTESSFPGIHVKARSNPYPRTTDVMRGPVPDDKVRWHKDFPEYKPVTYTSPGVAKGPVWADPDLL